jgi:hypothetical protein
MTSTCKTAAHRAASAVTAAIHPMRDGSPGGDLTKVLPPDGRELSAEITLNVAPGADASATAPAAQAALSKDQEFQAKGLEYRDDPGACWPIGMPRMIALLAEPDHPADRHGPADNDVRQ